MKWVRIYKCGSSRERWSRREAKLQPVISIYGIVTNFLNEEFDFFWTGVFWYRYSCVERMVSGTKISPDFKEKGFNRERTIIVGLLDPFVIVIWRMKIMKVIHKVNPNRQSHCPWDLFGIIEINHEWCPIHRKWNSFCVEDGAIRGILLWGEWIYFIYHTKKKHSH